jgi:hypothetical protein
MDECHWEVVRTGGVEGSGGGDRRRLRPLAQTTIKAAQRAEAPIPVKALVHGDPGVQWPPSRTLPKLAGRRSQSNVEPREIATALTPLVRRLHGARGPGNVASDAVQPLLDLRQRSQPLRYGPTGRGSVAKDVVLVFDISSRGRGVIAPENDSLRPGDLHEPAGVSVLALL